MNRYACILAVGAVAVSAALAQDSTLSDLKAQKAALEASKKEIQVEYDKAKAALFASDALAKEQAAEAKAEKALQEWKQNSKELSKARAVVAATQQGLADIVAKKVEETKEVKSAIKEVSEQEAKVPELQFKKRLLQINLNHEGSPVQLELAEDKAVIEAQNAAATAEQTARSTPSDQVVTTRKALAKVDEDLRKMQQDIGSDKTMQRANDAVAVASAALREAESKDNARAATAKMAEDVAIIRKEALQRVGSAKSYLMEQEEIAARKREVEGQRRGLAYIMDVNRKAVRNGTDKDVTAAADALAKARKALDDASNSDAIRKARKDSEEAEKTYNSKHDELFGKIPEYQVLMAKEDELRKKLAAMDNDITDATSAKSITKLIPELQKLRQDISDVESKKREIRIANGKDKWDAIYKARGDAARVLRNVIAASPEVAPAMPAVDTAEAALSKAIETAVAATKSGAAGMELQKELSLEAKKLAFRDAIAAHYLNDRDSAIRIAVGKDKKLIEAETDLQRAEKELRESPSSAVAKARKVLELAQAEANQVRAKLEQDDYKKASAARRMAEQDLRRAETADPARIKAEATRRAADQKRADALAGMKAARKITEEIKQLDDELASLQAAKVKVADARKQARAKVEGPDDKDIALAKKTIEEAKAELKTIEEGASFQELKSGIQKAKTSLEQARKDAEAKDANLAAIRKKSEEVNAQIGTLSSKIKDAEKAAAEAKKQETKKADDKPAEAKATTPEAK